MVTEDQKEPLEASIELASEQEENWKVKLAQQAKARWVSEENC